MDALTADMVEIIRQYSAGAVATVDDAGAPAVSPKATFVVINESQIAFGDIRSPNTTSNLRARPAVEVLFTDILTRRAVRIAGHAEVLPTDSDIRPHFEGRLNMWLPKMQHFVLITITRAELVLSPAYDIGLRRPDLHRRNLDGLNVEWITDHATATSAPTTNELGQPTGAALDQQRVDPPVAMELAGRFCDVVPLDASTHAPALHDAYSAATDDGDWTYMAYGPFAGEDDFRVWLETVQGLTDPIFFAVVDNATGTASGLVSFLRLDTYAASIEVGSIHLSRRLQRTAAATEAMYLMMKHAFDSGYRRYEWKCDDLNGPSIAAALRLGFRYEGTFRQATHYKGRNRDTAWFAILDEEWPALRAEFERWLDPANIDGGGNQRSALQARR